MNLNGMVSMWKVRELVDKATNIVMNYTETEAKVERFSFSLHHSIQCMHEALMLVIAG